MSFHSKLQNSSHLNFGSFLSSLSSFCIKRDFPFDLHCAVNKKFSKGENFKKSLVTYKLGSAIAQRMGNLLVAFDESLERGLILDLNRCNKFDSNSWTDEDGLEWITSFPFFILEYINKNKVISLKRTLTDKKMCDPIWSFYTYWN